MPQLETGRFIPLTAADDNGDALDVVTMFDVKQSKIESYVKSGRLIKVDARK